MVDRRNFLLYDPGAAVGAGGWLFVRAAAWAASCRRLQEAVDRLLARGGLFDPLRQVLLDRLAQLDRQIDRRLLPRRYAPIEIKSSWSRYAASICRSTTAARRCSSSATSGISRLRLSSTSIGRIVRLRGELAREPDVAVQQAAHGVADRLVRVVALDQHRVEGGDAARRGCGRPARPASAAGRRPRAGSRAWWAARRRPGRSRAGPRRSA